MKKKLYIYGVGGYALEIFAILEDSWDSIYQNATLAESYDFVGFVGTREYACHNILARPDFIDDKSFQPSENVAAILAIGRNLNFRRKVIDDLISHNVSFPNLIHPSVIVKSNNMGIGNIVAPFSIIQPFAQIGNFNFINVYSAIGHDCLVGNYNIISPYTHLNGGSSMGDSNLIGAKTCFLPNATIGNENIVAPGSFIYKRFRNKNLISGNPAVIQANVQCQ